MKRFVFLWVVLLPFLAKAVKVYTVNTVPNPKLYNQTYISNPDGILSAETVKQLNKELANLENITTDQVAVVVLGSIGQANTKNFAVRLFNRFRVGQKDKDNGLLILLVIDSQKLELQTGYGMEGVLTKEICQQIATEEMLPFIKNKEYNEGILAGVHEILKVLNNTGTDDQQFPDEKSRGINLTNIGKIVVWIMAVPYLLFIVIFYFVKQSRGSFTGDFHKLSEAKKRNILLTIPRWRWLLLYLLIPLLFYAFMIEVYAGPSYFWVLASGIYLMVLFVLLDKKVRSLKAYQANIKAEDYYDQYNKFSKYFDNWGIAAVFFPFPFLFTDAFNNRKLIALRKHERNCPHCHTPMRLLDDKKDEELVKKSQLLEESLQSADYDMWWCPSCHAHEVLGYPSKFSKFNACSYCGTRASFMESDITIVPANVETSGTGEKTYKCMYCKKVTVESYTIPPLSFRDAHDRKEHPGQADTTGEESKTKDQ